ncbi:MAG: hypothetical protein ACM3US_14635 [Sphingomonadaceae bacterium]
MPTDTPTATAEPTNVAVGYIEGIVDLQARRDESGAIVSAGAYWTVTSSHGTYALVVPPGLHTVTVSRPGYLTATRQAEVGEGRGILLPRLKLRSGDLVDGGGPDALVDQADLDYLTGCFGRCRSQGSDPGLDLADLTDDGCVDLFDLVAVASNWHRGPGLQEW